MRITYNSCEVLLLEIEYSINSAITAGKNIYLYDVNYSTHLSLNSFNHSIISYHIFS